MSAPGVTAGQAAAKLDLARLATRRWFRHRGQVAGPLRLVDAWPVASGGEPLGWWLIVAMPLRAGEAVYQVPVRTASDSPADAALLGEMDLGRAAVHLWDGAADPAMLGVLVERMMHGASWSTERGRVEAEVLGEAASGPTAVKPLAEASTNTLVGLGDGLLLKLYRCLDAAGTREVAMMAGLARAGVASIPAVVATAEYVLPKADRWALALVEERIGDAQDGWSWMTDLLAAGPRDVSDEAVLMGRAVAEMHRGMATMARTPWSDDETARLRTRILGAIDGFAGETDDSVLLGDLAAARAYAEAAQVGDGGWLTPVHGDLHLGQMMRQAAGTGLRYRVLDFEGEPLATVEERMRPHSPLKDVAGMLRSFDYAAGYARRSGAPGDDASWTRWLRTTEAAFLDAYVGGSADVLPANAGDRERLLGLYLVDKAVYEITYELRSRPDWVDIARGGLARTIARLTERTDQ